MTRSVYVGPEWPDGEPEPEAQSHFYCANDECPSAFGNGHGPVPNTRKYRVPGGYICELCAEAHDSEVAAEDTAATPAAPTASLPRSAMRCSTIPSTTAPGDDLCEGTATHLLLTDELGPDKALESVCKPCGESYVRRPALRARIVPLHVHRPTPLFKDIAGGHRLIDHPFHEAACHDCMRLGSVEYFRQGRDKGLHGCRFRPESVTSRELPATNEPSTTLNALASRWWKYVTHEIGMGIGDWHPMKDNADFAATFTFRDREYGLRHTLNGTYVWAEKLENRGRPLPENISPELQDSYRQVVFRFYDLINKYENTYFATYTPGREDVVLYTPEGAIRAVLRFPDLEGTRDRCLAVVKDAVCDTFGAIAEIQYQTRIYQ